MPGAVAGLNPRRADDHRQKIATESEYVFTDSPLAG
jgi:hypothetical protein